LCRKDYEYKYPDNFYCIKHNSTLCINDAKLCDRNFNCENGDDENFCGNHSLVANLVTDYCYSWLPGKPTDVEKVLCRSVIAKYEDPYVFFSVTGRKKWHGIVTSNIEDKALLTSSINEMTRQYKPRCHRGLDLRVWLNSTNSLLTCLCPPNFYGPTCEYQNERVILSLQIRTPLNSWKTLFSIIISLIDSSDERIIHSYKQLTYSTEKDCLQRFNFYLFYSHRPRNFSKVYSIHIDIYEKFPLKFRGSLLIPIPFQFLPVHHLSFFLDIPQTNLNDEKCLNDSCVNGKCLKYSNNESISFCHCNEG
jgi:hypothetical protein